EMIESQFIGLPGTPYELIDQEVIPGVIYYYRLEIIDLDGASTLTRPTFATGGYGVFAPIVIR
ncbi:MAG: hypothetical protein JXB15_04470, partial [Anaerolineales bacterium]|nr:hypothetical protein [Anaerolineales bacterium]